VIACADCSVAGAGVQRNTSAAVTGQVVTPLRSEPTRRTPPTGSTASARARIGGAPAGSVGAPPAVVHDHQPAASNERQPATTSTFFISSPPPTVAVDLGFLRRAYSFQAWSVDPSLGVLLANALDVTVGTL
jgi:hypothetical protein